MVRYFQKICRELQKVVSLSNKNLKYPCIVYAHNYRALQNQIEKSGLKYQKFPFISAFGLELNQNEIVKFAKISIVNFIAKQTKVSAQIYKSKKVLKLENFYKNNIFGENISLAVIDTGINPHIDFCLCKNRIIKFVDLIGGKELPYDDNGHGTYVTSIACGSGFASGGKFSGIAPKTNIVAIKALEENGESGAYKILEAMQWISDNYKRYNIRVVCMSFGSNPLGKNDPLIVGAEALWNMGIVVVAAAGNSGPDSETIKSPGFSSKIITVGGLDDNRNKKSEENFESNKNNGDNELEKRSEESDKDLKDARKDLQNIKSFKIAEFSSRGPAGNYYKPDLIAPAVDIVGAGFYEKNGTFYVKMSGTSVATPMIAGICCLIISKFNNITPDQIKIRLLNSCEKLSNNPNEEGFGLPNLTRFFG